MPDPRPTAPAPVLAVDGGDAHHREDRLAVEEPVEIRVLYPTAAGPRRASIAVTMRTPGDDVALALGFLHAEGVIGGMADVVDVTVAGNVVSVELASDARFDPESLRRNTYTTSSCGICGRASIEALRAVCPRAPVGESTLHPDVVRALPERLRAAQTVFAETGGLHAAALFDPGGRLRAVHEDVGRHNAVDKLVGRLLLDGGVPADDTVLLVSGRASWELAHKSLVAGIPVLCAVGAPSSLAVALAKNYGQTLIGFLRGRRFNVYTAPRRIDVARLDKP